MTPKQALRLAEQRLARKSRDREESLQGFCQATWTAIPVDVWRQIFDAEPSSAVPLARLH